MTYLWPKLFACAESGNARVAAERQSKCRPILKQKLRGPNTKAHTIGMTFSRPPTSKVRGRPQHHRGRSLSTDWLAGNLRRLK